MPVATFEAVVENGQIKLPDDVHLPEHTKVYVVIPGAGHPPTLRWISPRLARPEQAQDFKKSILPDANV